MFIALKTEDGALKGKISFYCKVLGVTRQGFHNYLKYKDKPWKYQALANAMLDICSEDECNDTYGRIRMHQALKLKQPEGVEIPNERTIYFLAIQMVQISSKGTPRNPAFRAYFERRTAEGKNGKQILICISRRLINIIYGMLKSGTEYRMPVAKMEDKTESA